MKRILSICILWIGCFTLWGQSSGGGYGGDYNPANPDDPSMPPTKYRLTVIATEGGTVEPNLENERYEAGSNVRVYAYNQSKYKFVHWLQNDSIKVSSSSSFRFTMPAEDVVLKAVFEYYPGQYGGEYDPNNPDDPSSTTTTPSYKLSVKSIPSNIGNVHVSSSKVNVGEETYVSASQHSSYKFNGWWLNGVLVSTELHYRFRMEDHDMDFTAMYEYEPVSPGDPSSDGASLTYNVYYQIDGYNYLTVPMVPGKKIVLPETPVRKGYSFMGWTEVPELMPNYDISIYGSFEARTYTIKFVVDGRTITRKLQYGTRITPPEMGTLEGNTLKWINLPTTMPDHDIVVNGEYSPITYTLIYKVDGVEYERLEYALGETVVPIPEPTREGFIFSGWSTIPETMPDSYVVINGSFIEPNQQRYKVTYIVEDEVYREDSIAPGAILAHLNYPYKEGHTFNIKSSLPVFMPSYDITIEGSFSVNTYKLTYVIGGEHYKDVVYQYGDTIDLDTPPLVEGSAFSGWNELPKTMPAHNVTLTGRYIVNGYTITYILDNEVYKRIVYQYAAAVTPMEDLTKEGYTFSGWSESPRTMPAKDLTITASFTKNRYRLTYWVDGKEHFADSLEYSIPITPLEEPAKEGYTFSGWSEIPDSMPAKDVLITGFYAINRYKVTYNIDSVEYHTDSINYAVPIVLIENPTKEGYTFSGWSETSKTMPANDVVINGSFAINTYKVSYMVDGKLHHADSIVYGTPISAIDYPTKEGYTFGGWEGVPETMPAGDVAITGSFSINSYIVTYIVDGVRHHRDTVVYAMPVVPIENPTKEGYTFSGWSETPKTMPANDVVINGSFAINTYKVSYMVDGKLHHADSIVYGTPISAIDYPTKEGYTFGGWEGVPETMPAGDVAITGSFSINSYIVTYIVDGVRHHRDTVVYAMPVVPIENPTKEGHTFSGWKGLPQAMPAKDITITGVFNINKYKLTYMVSGEVHYTDSIVYGQAITAIADLSKEGYTFSGWLGLPERMPANDVVASGEFILRTTQTDAQGLVYAFNDTTETFEVSNYTEALVKDVVIPDNLYGYPVSGIQNRALMGAEVLTTLVVPQSVTRVGYRAFYGCQNILYIEWGAKAALEASYFDDVSRHGNMLVYVQDRNTRVTYQGNVVVDNIADHIVLTEGLPFRNIREFTARQISYTHDFSKQTHIGVSGGWEALILPFSVKNVASEQKGKLLPFGKADFITSLPYWIANLKANGTFAYIDEITANMPFIMKVPNSDEYEDIYNISGNIIFSAEDVVVSATTSLSQPSGSGYTLAGCYEGVPAGSRVFALNEEDYMVGGATYVPGGLFASGIRDIRPFEAYVYNESSMRAPYLRIGGDDGTGLTTPVLVSSDDGWYTLQGIRLSGKPVEKGTYIHRNKVVYIK